MTNTNKKELMPGDRVLVFDFPLFIDDKRTPLSTTLKPATIIRRYGERKRYFIDGEEQDWIYPDLIDIVFDHRPLKESKAHFTSGASLIENV